jgi:predicted RNA binding protein YcfA (HicA-like mRNA interferase family)
MKYSRSAWDQLKKLTPERLTAAVERDGAEFEGRRGAVRAYRLTNGRRISIHYHPGKQYGRKLLETMLDDLGWTEDDLRRLKLIK